MKQIYASWWLHLPCGFALSLGHSGEFCKSYKECIDLQGQGAFWTLNKSYRNIHSNILCFLKNLAAVSLEVKWLHQKQCRFGFLCCFESTFSMSAWMFSPAQLFLFPEVCHNSLLYKKNGIASDIFRQYSTLLHWKMIQKQKEHGFFTCSHEMAKNCWGEKRQWLGYCREVCAVEAQQSCRALWKKSKVGCFASLNISYVKTQCEIHSEDFWEAVTKFPWIHHSGHMAGHNPCLVEKPHTLSRGGSAVRCCYSWNNTKHCSEKFCWRYQQFSGGGGSII